jgi:hypothetical protein
MSTDHTIQDDPKRLKLHRTLAAIIIVVGLILLIYMITVESEPGLLPLLLIVLGTGWYILTRARMRSRPE